MLTEEQQQELEEAKQREGRYYLWTHEKESKIGKPTFYKVNDVFYGIFLAAGIVEYDANGKELGFIEMPIRCLKNDPLAQEDLVAKVA